MGRRASKTSWSQDYLYLIIALCLLVLLGLNTVESAFFQMQGLSGPSNFVRVQFPAPGQYRFHCLGRMLELSWVIPVGEIMATERGLWLQVGEWEFFLPLRVNLGFLSSLLDKS